MFNVDVKNDALKRLENVEKKYNEILEETNNSAIKLFETREYTAKIIGNFERFINTIANSPKEFDRDVKLINLNTEKFNKVFQLKYEGQSVERVSGGIAGAGVLAGVGVASFGPTAAMAVATTFGTASTGAAIASLSGAAATKAALAWLGGGALVAGGSGIAGGSALLAVAGPLGWGIGAITLIGSAALAHTKNAEIAEEATKEAIKIEREIAKYKAIKLEIESIRSHTSKVLIKLLDRYKYFSKNAPRNYSQFTTDQKFEIGSLVNGTLALSKFLNRRVG